MKCGICGEETEERIVPNLCTPCFEVMKGQCVMCKDPIGPEEIGGCDKCNDYAAELASPNRYDEC